MIIGGLASALESSECLSPADRCCKEGWSPHRSQGVGTQLCLSHRGVGHAGPSMLFSAGRDGTCGFFVFNLCPPPSAERDRHPKPAEDGLGLGPGFVWSSPEGLPRDVSHWIPSYGMPSTFWPESCWEVTRYRLAASGVLFPTPHRFSLTKALALFAWGWGHRLQ